METIRIFIADHHVMVREGLVALLNAEAGFTVVGEADNMDDTIAQAKSLQPHIILLDSTLPQHADFDTIRQVQSAAGKARVLLVASELSQQEVRQALQAGAAGYILKASPFSELISAINSACRGEYYLSPEIKSDIIANFLKQSDDTTVHEKYNLLTRREKEVFRIIVSGHTINEVAEILNISPKTVAKHRASLMEKLEIYNVASLVRYAVKIGGILK